MHSDTLGRFSKAFKLGCKTKGKKVYLVEEVTRHFASYEVDENQVIEEFIEAYRRHVDTKKANGATNKSVYRNAISEREDDDTMM